MLSARLTPAIAGGSVAGIMRDYLAHTLLSLVLLPSAALAGCMGQPAESNAAPATRSRATSVLSTAVPSPSVPSPSVPSPDSAASVSAGEPEDTAACEELAAVLGCMKNKAPAAERAAIEASRKEVLAQLASLGPSAQLACRRALRDKAEVIEKVGCVAGRDSWSDGEGRSYPLGDLKPLADGCAKPRVGLASAPRSRGPLFSWPWVRQTLYAHPAFRVVVSAPKQPGQLELTVVDGEKTLTLFASCWDADTCNRLAAMYRGVVRSSRPVLVCGEIPLEGERLRAFVLPDDGRWLPDENDWMAACARLNACRIAIDASTEGDPGLACQRDPSKFDRSCAQLSSCRDVVACLAR